MVGGESVEVEAPSFKLYGKKDKREDYFMVDKDLAKETGLFDVLNILKWGEGRYGERIMDQESNLIMKGVMKSNRTDDEKKRLLGEHLFSELGTHHDFGGPSNIAVQAFVKGGEPIKNGNISYSDLRASKKLYNDWAKKNSFPLLKNTADGKLDQEVATAFANYNADRSNLRKIKTQGTTVFDSKNNNTSYLVQSIGLDKWMPELKPARPIGGFDKAGNAVFVDPTEDVNTTVDPKTGKLTIVNDDYLASRFPAWDGQTSVVNGTSTGSIQNNDDARARRFNTGSAIRNGISAASGITGAILATTPIPKWAPTAEYERMKGEVYSRKNQGFSAEEQSAINQGLINNYAQGIGTIRSVVGNGGNQGAVLGSLNQLSQNMDDSYLKAAQQNVALRRQNFGRYQNMVMTDMGIDQQMFQADFNDAMTTKQNGLAMVQDSNEKLFQEQMYRDSYGPDSLYNELQTAQLDRQRRYDDLARIQAENFVKSLSSPATSTQPVPGSIPLATTTINPLSGRLGAIVPRY